MLLLVCCVWFSYVFFVFCLLFFFQWAPLGGGQVSLGCTFCLFALSIFNTFSALDVWGIYRQTLRIFNHLIPTKTLVVSNQQNTLPLLDFCEKPTNAMQSVDWHSIWPLVVLVPLVFFHVFSTFVGSWKQNWSTLGRWSFLDPCWDVALMRCTSEGWSMGDFQVDFGWIGEVRVFMASWWKSVYHIETFQRYVFMTTHTHVAKSHSSDSWSLSVESISLIGWTKKE